MSCELRWEQCCSEPGCKAPARYGELCTRCTMAATPARRAVEMMAGERETDWDLAARCELFIGD